jgi:hypothetical protein
MNGVISKYYSMSCNTNNINYIIYVRKNKELNLIEKNNFKIVRYSSKLVFFRYYPLFKYIKSEHINIIRYAGADFSLLFLSKIKKKIFWELHTNYLLELGNKRIIGYIVKLFELTIGRYILQAAKGVISTSNSIFDVNKQTYKYRCNYHLLLNSFISSNPASSAASNDLINKRYILIMASSFSFWHDLQKLEKLISKVDAILVVVGNTTNKSFNNKIFHYGYVSDPNELNCLISNSLFCIDSIGFDSLELKETSSLKLFKYLEHGGRVVIFKKLPFIDSFLVPKYIIKLDEIHDLINLINELSPLTIIEQNALKSHMQTNYSLKKLLISETEYLYDENSRKE